MGARGFSFKIKSILATPNFLQNGRSKNICSNVEGGGRGVSTFKVVVTRWDT